VISGLVPFRLYYAVAMIAAVIVTVLLAALFAFSSSIKLLGVRQSLAIRDHLGVSPAQWRAIGLLELAGVVGVLMGLAWTPIGVAAAAGLALLSVGAVIYHVRASDRLADMAPAMIGIGLAVATAILQAV
jgi:DoxX-like family